MSLGALDVTTTKTVALFGLAVLVLIALAVIFIVRKIVVKLVVLVLVVAVGAAVWSQREGLADCPRTCSCSFFGYHIQLDDPTLNQACLDVVN